MRFSHLFTKTSKDAQSDAASINADLLGRGGYVSKTMAGVYSYLPLGLKVLKNIEAIVREEMDRIGGQEILMSALAPKENWMHTGRWNTVDVLFRLPASEGSEYALNPTHEEVVVPLVQRFVNSYKDLPFSCYQIQTKFRNEPRAKSGVLRGREFIMKDLYSFHLNQQDLEEYYAVAQGAYDKIWERLSLGERTYMTYASGGSFSKYSHEYQVLLPTGEDTIYVSVKAEKEGNRIAVNKEIFEEGKAICPVTGGTEFRPEKASEAGNIFQLGTKFSAPFKLAVPDAKGELQTLVMGCYGIGISRLMGILAEAFSDEKGLMWPAAVAPAQVHIVPIAKAVDEEAYAKACALYEALTEDGIECIIDDRLDVSVGVKLADADLIGIPMRVIVSPKTLKEGQMEVKKRSAKEATMMPYDGKALRKELC